MRDVPPPELPPPPADARSAKRGRLAGCLIGCAVATGATVLLAVVAVVSAALWLGRDAVLGPERDSLLGDEGVYLSLRLDRGDPGLQALERTLRDEIVRLQAERGNVGAAAPTFAFRGGQQGGTDLLPLRIEIAADPQAHEATALLGVITLSRNYRLLTSLVRFAMWSGASEGERIERYPTWRIPTDDGEVTVAVVENRIFFSNDRSLVKRAIGADTAGAEPPSSARAEILRLLRACRIDGAEVGGWVDDATVMRDWTGRGDAGPVALAGEILPDGDIRLRTAFVADGAADDGAARIRAQEAAATAILARYGARLERLSLRSPDEDGVVVWDGRVAGVAQGLRELLRRSVAEADRSAAADPPPEDQVPDAAAD